MNKIYPNVSNLRILSDYFSYDSLKVYIKSCEKCKFEAKKVNAFINNKCLWKKEIKLFDIVSDIKLANVIYNFDNSLLSEEYKILIENNLINVSYFDASGAFYATKTLEQILNNSKINNLEIIDSPKIKTRGLMFDISRDKVASVDTIKKVLDLMADLKMNHFELYVEGFSFEFKSYSKYLLKDGYISVDEYLDIQKYANDRFIDLVPNCNGFGHMAKWLELDEFKDLAVCSGGMVMWGKHRDPNTLDPLNPGSIELVKKLYNDIIPLSSSKYFNMNFDEPFELGHGNTEGMDIGKLYIDYMIKAYDCIKKYDKTPLMWGDVLLKHQDKLDLLPKDTIFIDWGYDARYSFDKHLKVLKEKNIKFMAAPGTTTWCSFLARFSDWYENIKNACDAVKAYDGLGVILTDWGDFGHLQFLNSVYSPLIYMGLYSWCMKEGTIQDVRDFLNNYYQDNNKVIGELLLDVSNSYRYDMEYCGNGSKTFYYFLWACSSIQEFKKSRTDPIEYYKQKIGNSNFTYPKFMIMKKQLENKIEELEFVDSKLEEFKITKCEVIQSIKLVLMIDKVSLAFNESVDKNIRINYLKEILNSKDEFINEQKRVWMLRNKSGGLDSSISYIECFMEFILQTLNYLERNGEQ